MAAQERDPVATALGSKPQRLEGSASPKSRTTADPAVKYGTETQVPDGAPHFEPGICVLEDPATATKSGTPETEVEHSTRLATLQEDATDDAVCIWRARVSIAEGVVNLLRVAALEAELAQALETKNLVHNKAVDVIKAKIKLHKMQADVSKAAHMTYSLQATSPLPASYTEMVEEMTIKIRTNIKQTRKVGAESSLQTPVTEEAIAEMSLHNKQAQVMLAEGLLHQTQGNAARYEQKLRLKHVVSSGAESLVHAKQAVVVAAEIELYDYRVQAAAANLQMHMHPHDTTAAVDSKCLDEEIKETTDRLEPRTFDQDVADTKDCMRSLNPLPPSSLPSVSITLPGNVLSARADRVNKSLGIRTHCRQIFEVFEKYDDPGDVAAAATIASTQAYVAPKADEVKVVQPRNTLTLRRIMEHVDAMELDLRDREDARLSDGTIPDGVITSKRVLRQYRPFRCRDLADIIIREDKRKFRSKSSYDDELLREGVSDLIHYIVNRYARTLGSIAYSYGIVMNSESVMFVRIHHAVDGSTGNWTIQVSPPLPLAASADAPGSPPEGILQLIRFFRMAVVNPDELIGFNASQFLPQFVIPQFPTMNFIEVLRVGSHSRVYHYEANGASYAIKVPKNPKGASLVAFHREQLVLYALSSLGVPSVPKVLYKGKAMTYFNGRVPFMALEPVVYSLGRLLGEHIKGDAPPPTWAQAMFRPSEAPASHASHPMKGKFEFAGLLWVQISNILRKAASRGFHHRDVRPVHIGLGLGDEASCYLLNWGFAVGASEETAPPVEPSEHSAARQFWSQQKLDAYVARTAVHDSTSKVFNYTPEDLLKEDLTALANVVLAIVSSDFSLFRSDAANAGAGLESDANDSTAAEAVDSSPGAGKKMLYSANVLRKRCKGALCRFNKAVKEVWDEKAPPSWVSEVREHLKAES